MEISIDDLERLLRQQKDKVIDSLLNCTGYYNIESDAGNYRTLPIDKEKFRESGMSASFPDDFLTLKKYGIK